MIVEKMSTHYKPLFLLISICVLALFPTTTAFAQQSDPVLMTIADATITPSNSATVDMTLDTGSSSTKIGAFSVTMGYDDSIIKVIDCEVVDYSGVCNSSVAGVVRVAGLDAGGIGDKSTAIRLTVEGVSTGLATIEITEVSTLITASLQSLDYTAVAGQIQVVDPVSSTLTSDSTDETLDRSEIQSGASDKFSLYLPLVD